jgi:hypothetical protein
MTNEKKDLIRKEGDKVHVDELVDQIMKSKKAVLKELASK